VLDWVVPIVPDAETLESHQAQLQAEADELRRRWGLDELLGRLGPVGYVGSYVSGLMAWREFDVMVLVRRGFSPVDVVALLAEAVRLPGVVGFEFYDESGPRSPTGLDRDERYHVYLLAETGSGLWRVDLTLWLNHDHAHLTAWHEELRGRITRDERVAILAIKSVWHSRPEYPESVGGSEIYAAVLDGGVRTPEQFARWLEDRRAG
jgi:hypothetical protein